MSALRVALLMALPFLEEAAEGEWLYGSFHGGDPRDFKPDPECSTAEEREAWEKACADAVKSEEARQLDDTHHWLPLEGGGVAHVAMGGFGLGTYRWRDVEAEHALAAALAALEQS